MLAAILFVSSANAVVIDTSANSTAITRSTSVSQTATFFKVDPNRTTIVEVVGSGTGTLKVSTDYTATPTSFSGFTADPQGSVSGNTAWKFPSGLSYVGLDAATGTWTVRVTQPK